MTTSDNKWQRMTKSDNEWQGMTKSGATSDSEWKRVIILAFFKKKKRGAYH